MRTNAHYRLHSLSRRRAAADPFRIEPDGSWLGFADYLAVVVGGDPFPPSGPVDGMYMHEAHENYDFDGDDVRDVVFSAPVNMADSHGIIRTDHVPAFTDLTSGGEAYGGEAEALNNITGDEAKKSGPVVLVQFADGYSDQFSAKEAIAYMKAKGYGIEDIASINDIALDV